MCPMDALQLNPAFMTPEHAAFQDTVRRFVARELEPHAGKWDEAGEYPRELHARAAQAGLLGLGFADEYGGYAAADMFHRLIACVELAQCGAGGVIASLMSHTIAAPPIALLGTAALQARVLPPILEGRWIAALAITEPSGGSDVAALRTTARRVGDAYVVNGEKVGSEKFDYKLRWLSAVREWLRAELEQHPNMIVLGDFNIAPDDRDVHDPKRWREKILCSTPERDALRSLLDLGLHDSFRLFNDEPGHHSWWDYRLAAFQRNWGLRIDLVLVSEALKSRVTAAGIDKDPRGWERPSDHTPVWVQVD